MTRPALFFDRDNTLILNGDYLGDPDKVVLMPGAADAIARGRAMGFAIVVVSNQSGVARGLYSEDDVRAVDLRMAELLLAENVEAQIDRQEFCPDHPEGVVEPYVRDSDRRKPKPGMLLDAARESGLNLKRSWVIGDAPRDVEAGRRAGCRTILLRDPEVTATSPAAEEKLKMKPDYIANSLGDALDFIEMHLVEQPVEPEPEQPVEARPGQRQAETEPEVIFNRFEPGTTEVTFDEASARPVMTALAPDQTVVEPMPEETIGDQFVRDERTENEGGVRVDVPSRREPSGEVILLERVVEELRRGNDPPQDFSVAKMLAGVVQGLAVAAMFAAVLNRDNPTAFQSLALVAIFLQMMVTSLLLMGR
jgi:D-glycero-D-manno-heptose 1,7-bisphosphate phosphatase